MKQKTRCTIESVNNNEFNNTSYLPYYIRAHPKSLHSILLNMRDTIRYHNRPKEPSRAAPQINEMSYMYELKSLYSNDTCNDTSASMTTVPTGSTTIITNTCTSNINNTNISSDVSNILASRATITTITNGNNRMNTNINVDINTNSITNANTNININTNTNVKTTFASYHKKQRNPGEIYERAPRHQRYSHNNLSLPRNNRNIKIFNNVGERL